MNTVIRTIPMLNASVTSFDRIQLFLESDARRDHRLPLKSAIRQDSSQQILDGSSTDIELEVRPPATYVSADPAVLVVQNASFAWTTTGKPAICDVSFIINRCQITFIIGIVGCGKSTLLKGLLGETPSSQGFVYSDSAEIAFVDQTPWIRNLTIQENILGISTLAEPWYSTVVHACGLDQDIMNLPQGHSTTVGSAGISLSGGQKQRIALARAVYSKRDLIFLDDVFSGLDAGTEEQIFNRLLGKQGLLREMGKTVLLVTHAGEIP